MRVLRLDPSHRAQVWGLLERDARANLFPLLLIELAGFAIHEDEAWYGAMNRGALEAVLLAAGRGEPGAALAVPSGSVEGCLALGASLAGVGGSKLLIGPRAAADAVLEGMAPDGYRTKYNQRMYICMSPGPGPELLIRKGTLDDLELAATWAADMSAEDLGQDPRDGEWEAHLARTRRTITEGRTLFGSHAGRLVFKVDIGLCGARGAMVGGTYVPPESRGAGFGAHGMRAVTRSLLTQTPVVALHVNEANRPAVRTYEAIGFRRSVPFRLCAR